MGQENAAARLTVTHPLIAGTGFLWAPVVMAVADALCAFGLCAFGLCAFGVNHHWPDGAKSFTTVERARPTSSPAREREPGLGATARAIGWIEGHYHCSILCCA
jgi:hypothetical protein